MKVFKIILLLWGIFAILSSCSSKDYNECYEQAVQTPVNRILDDLLADDENVKDGYDDAGLTDNMRMSAVCRILNVTPAILKRLGTGQTVPTKNFSNELTVFYAKYLSVGKDFYELRKLYNDYGFWDFIARYLYLIVAVIFLILASEEFVIPTGWGCLMFIVALAIIYIAMRFVDSVPSGYENKINPKIEMIK